MKPTYRKSCPANFLMLSNLTFIEVKRGWQNILLLVSVHLKENDSSYFAKVRHTFGLLSIAFGTVSSVCKRVRAIKVRSKIFDPKGTREVFYSKVIFATFGDHLVV